MLKISPILDWVKTGIMGSMENIIVKKPYLGSTRGQFDSLMYLKTM
jgi:hypothetical protein